MISPRPQTDTDIWLHHFPKRKCIISWATHTAGMKRYHQLLVGCIQCRASRSFSRQYSIVEISQTGGEPQLLIAASYRYTEPAEHTSSRLKQPNRWLRLSLPVPFASIPSIFYSNIGCSSGPVGNSINPSLDAETKSRTAASARSSQTEINYIVTSSRCSFK